LDRHLQDLPKVVLPVSRPGTIRQGSGLHFENEKRYSRVFSLRPDNSDALHPMPANALAKRFAISLQPREPDRPPLNLRSQRRDAKTPRLESDPWCGSLTIDLEILDRAPLNMKEHVKSRPASEWVVLN